MFTIIISVSPCASRIYHLETKEAISEMARYKFVFFKAINPLQILEENFNLKKIYKIFTFFFV